MSPTPKPHDPFANALAMGRPGRTQPGQTAGPGHERKVKITFYIPQSTRRRLRLLALETDRSMSSMATQIIEQILDQQKAPPTAQP
ncbi:MAG: hypothetical protein FWD59_01270 [Micrococcales bacterium]|nr:hypothetical protein [Micrococcales bacterium]